MTPARTTYVQVLHPNFDPRAREKETGSRVPDKSDYVIAPRLSLRGTYRVLNMLSPFETGRLFVLANQLEKEARQNGATRKAAVPKQRQAKQLTSVS